MVGALKRGICIGGGGRGSYWRSGRTWRWDYSDRWVVLVSVEQACLHGVLDLSLLPSAAARFA